MPEIIYEDNHLLIAVKPPNQLTQSDETGDLSLQDELKQDIAVRYQKPGAVYLGLVHRLDRPVGGLVAFARTSKAASRLSEQLRSHSMRREYLTVVEEGDRLSNNGTLHDYLKQNEKSGLVEVVSEQTDKAQEAILHYEKIAENPQHHTALLHIRLETGRKHQIRVQLSHMGCAIVNDMRYGHGTRGENIALWGAVLRLHHPTLKTAMVFTATPHGSAFLPYQNEIARFLQEQSSIEGESQ